MSDTTSRSQSRSCKAEGQTVPPTLRSDLRDVRGIILDLDGVIYRGETLLPGAKEFVCFLRKTGYRVLALTNHAGASAAQLSQKLHRLGVAIAEQDILTSAEATACYLAKKQPHATVYVLGSPALEDALHNAGLRTSPNATHVVVGFSERLELPRLTEATRLLLAGATLIGTNPDARLPTARGFVLECGPVLALLEQASGQRAKVVGKPNPGVIDMALARLGVDRTEALIVGDTVETDVAAGVAAGVRSVLVLTGNMRDPGDSGATVTSHTLTALQTLLQHAD